MLSVLSVSDRMGVGDLDGRTERSEFTTSLLKCSMGAASVASWPFFFPLWWAQCLTERSEQLMVLGHDLKLHPSVRFGVYSSILL